MLPFTQGCVPQAPPKTEPTLPGFLMGGDRSVATLWKGRLHLWKIRVAGALGSGVVLLSPGSRPSFPVHRLSAWMRPLAGLHAPWCPEQGFWPRGAGAWRGCQDGWGSVPSLLFPGWPYPAEERQLWGQAWVVLWGSGSGLPTPPEPWSPQL